MGVRETAIRITARGFDMERRLLNPGLNYVILLARDSSEVKGFRELRRYDAGFIARSDTFRLKKIFEIATEDDLSEDTLLMTHVAYKGRLYKIGEGDIVEPDDERFTWMIYGEIRNQAYVPN